jgi:hypothetical protein
MACFFDSLSLFANNFLVGPQGVFEMPQSISIINRVAVVLLGLALVPAMYGCRSQEVAPAEPRWGETQDYDLGSNRSTDSFTIGVAVIVDYPALQAAQDGFEDVLNEEGLDYELIVENA